MTQDPLLFPIDYQEVLDLYGPQRPRRATVKTPPECWSWYYSLSMPISSIQRALKYQQVAATVAAEATASVTATVAAAAAAVRTPAVAATTVAATMVVGAATTR